MKIIFNWILSALVVAVAAYLLPGVEVDGAFAALAVVVILALVNVIIKPFLLLLTLPINLLTLGLFTLVINAFMVILVDWLVPGFSVSSFWSALWFSILLFLINMVVGNYKKSNPRVTY